MGKGATVSSMTTAFPACEQILIDLLDMNESCRPRKGGKNLTGVSHAYRSAMSAGFNQQMDCKGREGKGQGESLEPA